MAAQRSIWPWIVGLGAVALLGGGTAMYAVAYRNGFPIGKIKLVRIDGKLVSEAVAEAFLAMRKAAQVDGIDLVLTSGFRTMEEQQRLWEAYQSGTGNLAARPGYSNHQHGTAVDISVRSSFTSPEYRWLAANAGEYGFVNTGKNFSQPEPWHWEYTG